MITIRFREKPRARWDVREFAVNIDAEQFVKSLPDAADVKWEGRAERPDPTPARAMWTGAVNFGLVNVPIKLYSATEDAAVPLIQACREHASPMRFKRWCDHGHELQTADITKAAKVGGMVIPLDEADLDELPTGLAKTVNIHEFVPAGSIPSIHRDRPYFVGPDKTGRHAYDLFVAALASTGTVAMCSIVIREREHLAVLEPDSDTLVLWTLRRAAEIRSNGHLPLADGSSRLDAAEIGLAQELIKSRMSRRFEPARYPDAYAARLTEIVERKSSESASAEPAATAGVIDLMESLRGSVADARKRREKVTA